MTYARAHLVDEDNGGFYHCTSRCVRRGWLCGEDTVTGQSYEHRKGWVESRLLMLCGVFSVTLYGYAVMSNHYHVVLAVNPRGVEEWDDEEVARRWVGLSGRLEGEAAARTVTVLMSDGPRLVEIRKRLGSLSWLMKYINEPIARRANSEDGCKGRFWEGRFKSIALLDEGAVLGCMAYVDLNPMRAKVVAKVADGRHTSIRRRLSRGEKGCEPLGSLSALGLTLTSYRALLEWTAQIDRGSETLADTQTVQALTQAGHLPDQWLTQVRSHRLKYRAYGALEKLTRYAQSLGQRWVKGSANKALHPV